MRKNLEYICVFGLGGCCYALLEILWRGYTHWSMVLTGGLCLLSLYLLDTHLPPSLLLRCLSGTIIITVAEFMVGCTVNLWWHMNVWDYSDMPYNLFGQICPTFTGLWFLLCIPAYWMCSRLRQFFRWAETLPHAQTIRKEMGP